jgi:hypothetical protein
VRLFRVIDNGIVNRFIKKSEHRAHLVISQTNNQQQQLKLNKNINSVVIKNSFVFDNKYNYTTEETEKQNIILWIGNMRGVKQPELFVQLAEQPGLEHYSFIMIGDAGGYHDTVPKPVNLKITGTMPKEEILKYLQKAKMIVNTSKTEGFSNTFFEAWVHNVFVISLNANPDNMLTGPLGYCAGGSLPDLIKKMHEMAKNEHYNYNTISDEFNRIKKDFDLTENINKLIHYISTI